VLISFINSNEIYAGLHLYGYSVVTVDATLEIIPSGVLIVLIGLYTMVVVDIGNIFGR
jgi:hypothetical protein